MGSDISCRCAFPIPSGFRCRTHLNQRPVLSLPDPSDAPSLHGYNPMHSVRPLHVAPGGPTRILSQAATLLPWLYTSSPPRGETLVPRPDGTVVHPTNEHSRARSGGPFPLSFRKAVWPFLGSGLNPNIRGFVSRGVRAIARPRPIAHLFRPRFASSSRRWRLRKRKRRTSGAWRTSWTRRAELSEDR